MIGGGGGGGKTDAALMRLLKWADVPGYSGWALRINYAQMIKSDAIMARAITWWRGQPGVRWDPQTHTFTFDCPGGGHSTIAFGHMDSSESFYDYQGAAAHCVIFDELTHFQKAQYTYLFSRQRRPSVGPLARVPLFMGATANPGGIGHQWVYDRFLDPERENKRPVYIPSTVLDNPSVDHESYLESLAELDPVTRKQLELGSWDELEPGDFFDRSSFVLIQEPPGNLGFLRRVRYWDFASKEEPGKRSRRKDPDYTASCLMAFAPGMRRGEETFYVLDVTEDRWDAGILPDQVRLQAVEDGVAVAVRWEQEGGSSGAIASERAFKPELRDFDADGIRSTGSKVDRARPIAARVSKRRVHVVENARTRRFLNQCHHFPNVDHDDMVDALSGAANWLIERGGGALVGVVAKTAISRALDEGVGGRDWRDRAGGEDAGRRRRGPRNAFD